MYTLEFHPRGTFLTELTRTGELALALDRPRASVYLFKRNPYMIDHTERTLYIRSRGGSFIVGDLLVSLRGVDPWSTVGGIFAFM